MESMRDKIAEKKFGMPVQHWRRVGNVLSCVLIVLFLSACGNGELLEETRGVEEHMADDSSEYSDAPLMTREYAIEHEILTEAELYGVDFEAIAERYDWREGSEENWNIKFIIKFIYYKDKADFLLPDYELIDYSWLVTDAEQEEAFTEEDIEQITTIGFSYQWGDSWTCILFDLINNKKYKEYDSSGKKTGLSIYRIGVVETTEEFLLTDDQAEEVKRVFCQSAVYEWEPRYEGVTTLWNHMYDKDFSWQLYYALEDGRIYSNTGYGYSGNNMPYGWDSLHNGFRAFFH